MKWTTFSRFDDGEGTTGILFRMQTRHDTREER